MHLFLTIAKWTAIGVTSYVLIGALCAKIGYLIAEKVEDTADLEPEAVALFVWVFWPILFPLALCGYLFITWIMLDEQDREKKRVERQTKRMERRERKAERERASRRTIGQTKRRLTSISKELTDDE